MGKTDFSSMTAMEKLRWAANQHNGSFECYLCEAAGFDIECCDTSQIYDIHETLLNSNASIGKDIDDEDLCYMSEIVCCEERKRALNVLLDEVEKEIDTKSVIPDFILDLTPSEACIASIDEACIASIEAHQRKLKHDRLADWVEDIGGVDAVKDMINSIPNVVSLDGKFINRGDTVYGQSDGKAWVVDYVVYGTYPVVAHLADDDGVRRELKPQWLTFKEVELDTQEKIDADSRKSVCVYFGMSNDMFAYDCQLCPAFDSFSCYDYKIEDLLRRQCELDKRLYGNGEE